MSYAWSTPKTNFAPGDILTASQLNNIGNNIGYANESANFAVYRPSADVTLTTSFQACFSPNKALDKEGHWEVTACVQWESNDTTTFSAQLFTNGANDTTNVITCVTHANGDTMYGMQTWDVDVASAPQNLNLFVKKAAGGGTSKALANGTWLKVRWVSP